MLWCKNHPNCIDFAIHIVGLIVVECKLLLACFKSFEHCLFSGYPLTTKLASRCLKVIKELVIDTKNIVNSDILDL